MCRDSCEERLTIWSGPVADLFAISVADMIRECEREIIMRRKVYPRRVENRTMRQGDADRQIAVMQAIIERLKLTA